MVTHLAYTLTDDELQAGQSFSYLVCIEELGVHLDSGDAARIASATGGDDDDDDDARGSR